MRAFWPWGKSEPDEPEDEVEPTPLQLAAEDRVMQAALPKVDALGSTCTAGHSAENPRIQDVIYADKLSRKEAKEAAKAWGCSTKIRTRKGEGSRLI
jgi:hypothetical protein